jgi:hypothetical protein
MAKRKGTKDNGQKKREEETNNDLHTKNQQKTKDRTTRTPLKTGGELKCSDCLQQNRIISGSYGTVVVKFKKWRRKLVEIAREYTVSLNPRYLRVWREARKFVGYFVWKITILRQKNQIFFQF